MFRLAAEFAGSENPYSGQFVVGVNLLEVQEQLKSGLLTFNFENPINQFVAVCIQVDGAPSGNSALILDNYYG